MTFAITLPDALLAHALPIDYDFAVRTILNYVFVGRPFPDCSMRLHDALAWYSYFGTCRTGTHRLPARRGHVINSEKHPQAESAVHLPFEDFYTRCGSSCDTVQAMHQRSNLPR